MFPYLVVSFKPTLQTETMEEPKEKRYRKVIVNLPEHLAFKVEKRLGGNSINALVKLFLQQFARGKAGLTIEFQPTVEEVAKLEKQTR